MGGHLSKNTSENISESAKIPRKYDNTTRAEKAARTQAAILRAYIELLVERRGEEVQIAEVARNCGITQRTVFRFFKDKKCLQEAMDAYLVNYLSAAGLQMETLDFVGFAKNVFKLFDEHENLTTAYVLSSFGQQARVSFRKKLTSVMIQKIQQEKKLDVTPERLKRLALITSLVNAKIWHDIKSDFGFSGAEMEDAVGWALKTLIDEC